MDQKPATQRWTATPSEVWHRWAACCGGCGCLGMVFLAFVPIYGFLF